LKIENWKKKSQNKLLKQKSIIFAPIKLNLILNIVKH